jgi:enamine deaminase RidA (YjgF/YER057c/UK114 family)
MSGKIDVHLKQIGIEIPATGTAAGNYANFVISGNLAYIAGSVPIENGERKFIGKVGREFSIEQGQQAAELAALNMLARLKQACGGDLDRVVRCVRLTGYVNAPDDFTEQPKVINGASDLMVKVFGDAGIHSRTAVGVASLPFGVAAEVEGIFEIR